MMGMLDNSIKLKEDPISMQEARIVRTLLRFHSNGEITKALLYNRIRLSGPHISFQKILHLLFPHWLGRLVHTSGIPSMV